MPLARAHAAAYGRVLDAYLTPRHDEGGRSRKIRDALSEAADVPLSIAEIGEVAGNAARLLVLFGGMTVALVMRTGHEPVQPVEESARAFIR